MEVFYVVWNPQAGNPAYRHESESMATKEARRLALQNPGQRFYVLCAVNVSEHNAVTTTQLEHGLPF